MGKRAGKHTQHGMTLIEVMVAVVVLGAAVIGFAYFMSSFADSQARDAYVDQEAHDLAMMHKAFMRYRADKKQDLITAWGTSAHADTPTMPALMASGDPTYLPANFAKRGGTTATSPWLQRYRSMGIIHSIAGPSGGPGHGAGHGSKVPMWVVYETGGVDQGALKKSGVDAATPEAIAGLKRDIVTVAARKYGVPAAYVDANASLATGAMGAWTKDLGADFKGNFPTSGEGRAVVLVGYPDLEGEDGTGGTGTSAPAAKWDKVQLVYANQPNGYPATSAVCPAGTQEVVSWPTCGVIYKVGYLIYQSDVGTITLKSRRDRRYVYRHVGFRDRSCLDGGYGAPACKYSDKAFETTADYQEIYLNGYLIGTDRMCEGRGVMQGIVWPRATSDENPDTHDCKQGTPSETSRIEPCVRDTISFGYRRTGSPNGPPATNVKDKLCGVPLSP